MKKRFLSVLVTGLFFLTMANLAQATLTTIGTAEYDGTDYNLIWDDNNNGKSLIWLDYSNERTERQAQHAWAAGLDSDLTYNFAGYNVAWNDAAWRLPDAEAGPHSYGNDGPRQGIT